MSLRVSARTYALSGTFVLALLIAACSSQSLQPSLRGSGGSDTGSDSGIGASDGGGTGVFVIPGDPEQGAFVQGTSSATFDGVRIEAKIVVQDVTPGTEQHVCVIVELPIASDVWVKEVDATLSGGSHHLIADRGAPGAPVQQTPKVCTPTTASDATRLMIAQQATTQILLPTGAAFSIKAHQSLFLQLHYLNTGTTPRDITGTVDLVVADPGGQTPTEALSLFTGSMAISLAPNSPGRAESFFVPAPTTGLRHVFALTSHTHRLGIDSTIERVPSETSPPTTPIHESKNWDDPPLTQFDPTLDFDGSDGLRLVCNYLNTTSSPVTFGTGTTAEMCFMWIYYFDR
jgi:hypothetical protein